MTDPALIDDELRLLSVARFVAALLVGDSWGGWEPGACSTCGGVAGGATTALTR
jgi:hypothetical protein